MTRLALSASMVLVILSVSIFANIGFTEVYRPIGSHGIISYGSPSLTVILRHLGNPMPNWKSNIDQEVDWWVANHSWIKGGAVLIDVEDVAPILWFNRAGYDGYSFKTTSGIWSANGWTFNQLKTLIDRLHYHDVRVVLAIIGFAKPRPDWGSGIWNYINASHRELFYRRRDNSYYGIAGSSYSFPAPLNWFANFSTSDEANEIIAGTRLADLFTDRLKEMIEAGLEWDGIFGSEGWGSVGNWGGGTAGQWIDASYQLINEWGNASSEHHPAGFPPANWDTWNNTQRADWINSNANTKWRGYWGMRIAQFFKQVHDAIQSVRPTRWFVGEIFSPDITWMDRSRATTWSGWSQDVGYNATYFRQYLSEPTFIYFIDMESTGYGFSTDDLRAWAELGKQQAYVSARIREDIPEANIFIGLMTSYGGNKIPLWTIKMSYLAQAQNYAWINGTRHRTSNPARIMFQYPDTGLNGYVRKEIRENLFDWIRAISNQLSDPITPVWLGPTFPTTYMGSGSRGFMALNYTFAQWAYVENLQNHPEYIVGGFSNMNSIFLSAVALHEKGALLGLQDRMLKSFASGNLSILVFVSDTHMESILQRVWGEGASDSYAADTFNMSGYGAWLETDNYTVKSSVSDPHGAWIISGYEGNVYAGDYPLNYRDYEGKEGFIVLVNRTNTNRIYLGIFYNSTSARYVYSESWSKDWLGKNAPLFPREILNRAIYWASYCPINSSEALIDLKIFEKSDGTILIPMMNHKDMGNSDLSYQQPDLSSILKLNATKLGLGSPTDYIFYWASDAKVITVSDWNNVQVTLKGGGDVLVIKPIIGKT